MPRIRFPYRGAGIGLILEDSILMGKRSHGLFLDSWAVPGGGKEKGEDFLTCAKREFFEETGCNLDSLNPNFICSWSLNLLPFFRWTTFFYKIELFDLTLKPSEFSELKWIPLKKVGSYKCRPFTNCEIKRLLQKPL